MAKRGWRTMRLAPPPAKIGPALRQRAWTEEERAALEHFEKARIKRVPAARRFEGGLLTAMLRGDEGLEE